MQLGRIAIEAASLTTGPAVFPYRTPRQKASRRNCGRRKQVECANPVSSSAWDGIEIDRHFEYHAPERSFHFYNEVPCRLRRLRQRLEEAAGDPRRKRDAHGDEKGK